MRRGAKPFKARVESRKKGGSKVRDLEKRLAEALAQVKTRDRALIEAQEQQTATSEILRAISNSPGDVQPVFDAIAQSATRLCEAADASIFRVDGDRLAFVAHHGPTAQRHGDFSLPLVRGTVGGRSVLESRTVHVADLQNEDREFPDAVENARRFGFRTILSVPLLREGVAIGGIQLRRTEVQLFSERQVALLQTFADQAVIAIENVRLFNETKEALEQQTATAEVLRVISKSPTDVQPVFDAIVQSAVRLCDGDTASAYRFDGRCQHLAAHFNVPSTGLSYLRSRFPREPERSSVTGLAILDRVVVHVSDLASDPRFPGTRETVAATPESGGPRAVLAVPMVQGERSVGAIFVSRRGDRARPFSTSQIELLRTFADQAVIAIENVRLFTELQEKNRALTEAHAQVTETLEQQTATGEILRVLSSSPTDAQPVFDAIARSAVQLCGASFGSVFRFDGELIHMTAHQGLASDELQAALQLFPMRMTPRGIGILRAIRERRIVHIPDIKTDEEWQVSRVRHTLGPVAGYRSFLAVPLLRDDVCLGVINAWRREPGPFSDKQISLLQTFADQAVIAIENVRLFKELQENNRALTEAHARVTEAFEQQGATSEVLRVISTFPTDVHHVFDAIVRSAVRLCEARFGAVFRLEGGLVHLAAHHNFDERQLALLRAKYPMIPNPGHISGRAILAGTSLQIADIFADAEYQSAEAKEAGFRSLLGVPIIRGGTPIGSIVIYRTTPGEFADKHIALLKTFADQALIAIENFGLFMELQARTQELEDKSRQLEAASQHKSEFLANMSHELRTPLNAVIGFSEVLSERMFGDLNEKQDEYLKDIHASGQHLLSLINDILDLSKIEAGRMELEVTDFNLPATLENALTLVRERAGRRDIALDLTVDERLDQVRADERKVRQVVLNLLSNAIKFTPEGGRIELRAVPRDGTVEVSVSDTGVGIAPEDQEAIFEEFKQVGTAAKKVEGTGLGLALSRKFIELHGGRIWVKSQVGAGSTFTFTIPVRRGD